MESLMDLKVFILDQIDNTWEEGTSGGGGKRLKQMWNEALGLFTEN